MSITILEIFFVHLSRAIALVLLLLVAVRGFAPGNRNELWLTMSTQQLKYGDKSHALQSSPETHRYELYKSSDDDEFEFAGLINHTLTVQRAEELTAGVDSALEQLRSSMAAISELKEANKYDSMLFS
jgi:hypothetical protein